MKTIFAIILLIWSAALCRAGTLQDSFQRSVAAASRVQVTRTRDQSVIVYSDSPAGIRRFIAAIEMTDPVVERTADGEEVIVLPCFCAAEYCVLFSTPAGEYRLFIKDAGRRVFTQEAGSSEYSSDIMLTRTSTKKLMRLIRKAQSKRPNQAPEPTPMSVTPPAAQEPRQP